MYYHRYGHQQRQNVASALYFASKKCRLSISIVGTSPLYLFPSFLAPSFSSSSSNNQFHNRSCSRRIDDSGYSHLSHRWTSKCHHGNHNLSPFNRWHSGICHSYDSFSLSSKVTQAKRCSNKYHNYDRRMYYHVTSKKEIIPVIIVGAIVVIGFRYSYRAVQRMRQEQDDYQFQLQKYERQQMKFDSDGTTASTATTAGTNESATSDGPIITMAIDLGTTYMKLSTATYRPSSPVTVQVSREGDRSTFNGVLYEHNNDESTKSQNAVIKATGRGALERYYYPNTMVHEGSSNDDTNKDTVSLPFLEFTTTHDDEKSSSSLSIVSDVLKTRMVEVMDRIHSSTVTIGSNQQQKALVRHVVTVPSLFLYNESAMKLYQNSFIDCCTTYTTTSSSGSTNQQPLYDTNSLLVTFIPEPVATVWGAQFSNLIPTNHPSNDVAMMASYCIIDVGGWTTQVSIVQNDKLKYTTTIPWGGESIIEQLVLLLKQQGASSVSDISNSSSSNNTLNDSRSLSLLQYHARQAVMELSTQSRVSIHVPYLYANPSHHHMETNMARNVLNQAIEYNIQTLLSHQRHRTTRSDDGQSTSPWLPDSILSPHLPVPSNLSSLWTSILTQALEQSGQLPTNITAVVLVGGGSKYAHVQTTIQDAWNMLTGGGSGGSGDTKFHFDSSTSSELNVVGAATLPPSFDYSLTDGLVRR